MTAVKTEKIGLLKTNITAKAVLPEVSVSTGDRGQSVTRLAPMGNARFGMASIEVTALDGMISAGTQVKVVMIDGQKIYVKECK